MALIDHKGRLLGRVNLIDAALLISVLALIPMGIVAFSVFRERPPRIDAVQPSSQPAGLSRRIRITGDNFRPYQRLFFGRVGEPFSLQARRAPSIEGRFLLESPTEVEVELPALAAGSYDIHLFDENREILMRPSAVTLEPSPMTLSATVRFAGLVEVVSLMKTGDADLSEIAAATTPGGAPRAVIEALAPAGTGAVDARLAVPAAQDNRGIWMYGRQPIRSGDAVRFETARYSIHGVVTTVAPRDTVKDGSSDPRGARP